MQPVDRDEFFRKIERRTKMVHTRIQVLRICDVVMLCPAAEAEDARAGSEHGIPLRRLLHVLRPAKVVNNNVVQSFRGLRIVVAKKAVPVCIQGFVADVVIEVITRFGSAGLRSPESAFGVAAATR